MKGRAVRKTGGQLHLDRLIVDALRARNRHSRVVAGKTKHPRPVKLRVAGDPLEQTPVVTGEGDHQQDDSWRFCHRPPPTVRLSPLYRTIHDGTRRNCAMALAGGNSLQSASEDRISDRSPVESLSSRRKSNEPSFWLGDAGSRRHGIRWCVGLLREDPCGSRADAAADDQDTDLVDQVRETKNELKEINKLLHSGTLRVMVVINPDAPR